ncbi:flagellin [Limnohabitans sp.]|uniref:flagellin N-terminal helical domain-containing protein n=1 Tax=Limnohabitans sp. TaxID=1907725 RepID=UPI00334283AC
MSVINTNVKSLVSQNAMVKNNRDLSDAMQQLSTGKRINSAADDAAGLAISSRMTSQITGLNQAVRNGNDSVSMLQTTEGAMIEMTNMLQRMRELSVQSSNDTYTESDRIYLDLEYQQLKDEVNRITKDTQWNGMSILDGTLKGEGGVMGKFNFQVGANENQVITHTVANMGYRENPGKAALLTTVPNTVGVAASSGPPAVTAVTAVKQVTTLTLSGDFAVGDKVSITIGNATKTYEVTEADVKDKTQAEVLAAVSTGLLAQTTASFGGTDVTRSGAVITFTAATAGTPFTPTKSETLVDGALANIRELNVKDRAASTLSIEQLDKSINRINSERAGLGAVINRLTHAMDNLTNVAQNTSESRSRIMDADYAKSSSELARTQIISQAATAMLAQANQQPQTVLKLLQG